MFIITLIVGYEIFLKFYSSSKLYPDVEGVFLDKYTGLIEEKRPIKKLLNGKWRLDNDDPTKVKFNVPVNGIGKSEPKEWDKNDILELNYSKNNKKLIIFGVRSMNQYFSNVMEMKQNIIDRLTAKLANVTADYQESVSERERLVKKYAETSKDFIAFQPPKKDYKK